MNRSDTKLTLDCRDKRRALEQRSSKGLESACKLCLATWEFVVQADIFLPGTLLRLYKSGCSINADNQTASNFGIEGSAVAGLLDSAI